MLHTPGMETVGGYRLVRTLGVGERAQIHLGHAGAGEPPESRRIAAVKIFRPSTSEASIDQEIEALARASSRHLLELRDLAAAPDGRPCLILPRLGSGSLARLLALRGTIEPGEAVTLLVPLVDAIRELHRVGVSHGRVRTSSVLFDDRGAPVLARFGEASLIGEFPATDGAQSRTAAQLDDDPRAADDRRGILTMTGAVLDRLTGDGEPGALPALRRLLDEADATTEGLERLVPLLFELAPGLPLRFDDAPGRDPVLPGADGPGAEVSGAAVSGAAAPLLPAMPIRSAGHPVARGEAQGLEAQRLGEQGLETLGFDAGSFDEGSFDAGSFDAGSFHEGPTGSNRPMASLFARLRATAVRLLGPVRTPVWIAGGAGVGALVVALTVVPAASSPSSRPAPSVGPQTAQHSAGARPSTPPTAPAGDAAADAAAGTAADAAPAGAAAAIAGEDPLAAARALLAARTACFATRSVECFDGVDQAGSAVLEADRHLVRRLAAGAALPPEATLDGFAPRLVQQLGDSAIIQLVAADGSVVAHANPAPLLMVRSEAGWRIRDLSVG